MFYEEKQCLLYYWYSTWLFYILYLPYIYILFYIHKHTAYRTLDTAHCLLLVSMRGIPPPPLPRWTVRRALYSTRSTDRHRCTPYILLLLLYTVIKTGFVWTNSWHSFPCVYLLPPPPSSMLRFKLLIRWGGDCCVLVHFYTQQLKNSTWNLCI